MIPLPPSMPLPVSSGLGTQQSHLSASHFRYQNDPPSCPLSSPELQSGQQARKAGGRREAPRNPHCPRVLGAPRGPAPHCKARPTPPRERPARGFPGQPRRLPHSPPDFPSLSAIPSGGWPLRLPATQPTTTATPRADPDGTPHPAEPARGAMGSPGFGWAAARGESTCHAHPAAAAAAPRAQGAAPPPWEVPPQSRYPAHAGSGRTGGKPKSGRRGAALPRRPGSRLCPAPALARAPGPCAEAAAGPGASKAQRLWVRDSATAESLRRLLASHPDPLNP
ncbi:proline-rich protein HaeIII subfamily 1-like [Acomys russatus]|uniref:proline-rich protein HaeIII subfamily 1-like n=1 Tax=Acomys russatus TaxID=60746 RepID=UPI0021E3097F|nr:proline-rich protein HaeIII subfamily 1-like [Acomys russatus]